MDLIDIEQSNAFAMPEEAGVDENEIEYKVKEIKNAITKLPDGYRTVLSLYLLEGYDQEEIASILGITHTTVRTQYIRAKQKLLYLLKEGGLS